MRLVTYLSSDGPRVAGMRDGAYVDLHEADSQLPTTLKELLAAGEEALARAGRALASGAAVKEPVKLLAPIPDPQKVLCVGLNYADHARESGMQPPSEPVYFSKLPTSIIGPDEPIVLPTASSQVDYEAELVIIIGRAGRDITPARAGQYIAGYTVGHDVSARDWQLNKPGKQWLLGKSFDTFAPLGPALVTPDEVGDVGQLRIQLRLNDQTLQDSNTNQLIFSVEQLVAYVSQVCTLLPGDVIYTGTPPGVGFARQPEIYMQPGDVAEVEIEKLGVLRNPVVAAEV